jgi:hypothetical protein
VGGQGVTTNISAFRYGPFASKRWRQFMMMDMSAMGTGMMVGMGVYHLAIFIFALLGIAASIKYLRS